ncbi:DUF1349 domain-containing protein [Occallatibacter riparius]|uniref:DUF1349 domain-containing protein n=1 Tax=Occallatibacter riparius TaxID=1002689 RepID=A0A9J7BVE0_9BACT|nr:hypothetical protein [Occallatibacter riparius]UWZ86505.1 hypothetical protein MOP44_11295 [Occallatibacter riparius]
MKALALLLALAAAASAQSQKGLFTGSTDIGKTEPGNDRYDPVTRSYYLTGGGADMWSTSDDFHLTWIRLSGDITITADIYPGEIGSTPLAKAVLIVRQSLAPDSAYADVAIHRDGHVALQWRENSGGLTRDSTAPRRFFNTLRLERKGDIFTAYAQGPKGRFDHPFASYRVPMTAEVYVGLGFCAHDEDGLATATFTNVKIDQPH